MRTSIFRYSLFIVVALAAIYFIPEFLRSSGLARAESLAQELEQEVSASFDSAMAQSQDSTRTMTRDYSIWNEMVDLAEGRKGIDWARENVDVSLDTYHTNGVWIYSTTGELRYSAWRRSDGHSVEMAPFFMPVSRVKEFSTDKQQHSFYVNGPDGTYFVSVGGIVPVTDPDRLKELRGYLVVATLLSDDALAAIAATTHTTIAVKPPVATIPANTLDTTTGTFIFWRSLKDETGQSVGALRVERAIPSVSLYSQTITREATYSRIAVALALAGLGASLFLIDKSRDRAQKLAVAMTAELRKANQELEQRVADRTKSLLDDIERRQKVEQELRRRIASEEAALAESAKPKTS